MKAKCIKGIGSTSEWAKSTVGQLREYLAGDQRLKDPKCHAIAVKHLSYWPPPPPPPPLPLPPPPAPPPPHLPHSDVVAMENSGTLSTLSDQDLDLSWLQLREGGLLQDLLR